MHRISGDFVQYNRDKCLNRRKLLFFSMFISNLNGIVSDNLSHLVRISHSIEAVPGDRVAFECSTSTKADKFDWTHNGSLLQNITGIRLSHDRLIVKVSPDLFHSQKQTGEYQCIAWFGPNAVMSVPATLRIATISNFSERPNVTVEVPIGNTAVIRCDPPYSNPAPSIQFYKEGLKITNDQSKYNIMPSGVLQIYNSGKSDEGTYTCHAINDMTGELRVARHVVVLKMNSKPDPVPLHFVTRPLQKYEIKRDSNLTMECVVNGNPVPKILWSKYGGTIDSSKHIISNGSLILTNVNSNDEGAYICSASNLLGESIKQVSHVSLLEKPSVTLTATNSKVEESSSVSFECLSSGKPRPEMYWSFNGNKIKNDSQIIVTDNMLMINNVTKKHAGAYQCFAVSGIGASSGTELLYVIPLPVSTWTMMRPPFNANKSKNDKKTFKNSHKGHRKKTRRKFLKTKVQMIPPSKPNVTRLSDDSVMITWEEQNQTGSQIQFYKVQYKEAIKGAKWETVDDNIPCNINSHAVMGLIPNRSYRFRIAAVYSNEDNKVGENSSKFTLSKIPASHRPSSVPQIISLNPISENALELQWEVSQDVVPVEGFIIYYRMTTSAGEYIKRTVWGSSPRNYVLFQLKPGTAYEVKMTSFNEAGTSGYSYIMKAITYESELLKSVTSESIEILYPDIEMKPSKNQLYIVVGSVVGGLIFLLLTCCILYRLKCKHQPTTTDRHSQEKFLDIAQKINLEQKTFGFKPNGCLMNGRPSDLINITANPLSDIDVNKNLEGLIRETPFNTNSSNGHCYKLLTTFRPHSPTPLRHYSQDNLDCHIRRKPSSYSRKNTHSSLARNSLPPGDWIAHNTHSLGSRKKPKEHEISLSKPELYFPQQTSV